VRRPPGRQQSRNAFNHSRDSITARSIAAESGPDPVIARGHFFIQVAETDLDGVTEAFEFLNAATDEPNTIVEALQGPDAAQWREAMDAEHYSLTKEHKVWQLTELPHGRRTISSRWTFKVKKDANGDIEKFKARLCAKGFTQRAGIDYFDTFAPVMKPATLRVLVSMATARNLEIHQIDVKTAFLYGKLDEEIFMRQPPGYITPGQEHLVCRLLRGLYGLKQASRAWNQRLNAELVEIGFTRSDEDPCLYLKGEGDSFVAIGVHVDDGILVGKASVIEEIKSQVKEVFTITDGGDLAYFLGLEFIRDRENQRTLIHQTRYTTDLLVHHQMEHSAPKSTPWDSGVTLSTTMSPTSEEEREEMTLVPYRQAVGELMFLSVSTRPDIAHAVGQCARFVSNPGLQHWSAVKRIHRYLNGTRSLGIGFDGEQSLQLLGYSDANWAGQDNRRSTSGNLFMLGGGAISWRSQQQQTVALSTMESEYMSLSACTQQAVWLRRLLLEIDDRLGMMRESGPTHIMEDNQACIQFAKDPKDHTRAKHIAIRYHFVREKILAGDICVDYCHTNEMIADLLTKAITSNQFRALLEKMGMRDCRN
jgi:hypothetical protein